MDRMLNQMTGKIWRISALAGALVLAVISAADAQTASLAAHLFGNSVVPQTKSDAYGEAQFTYDSETRQLDYYVTYDGAAPTRIDLHGPAAPGENAGAVAVFSVSESPVTGKVTLTPEQANVLLAGKMYVDLHSQAYANGEIRGQIQKH